MELAIVGSRSFNDYALLKNTMWKWWGYEDYHSREGTEVSSVISGGAEGADRLAAQWAREWGVGLQEILPDWDKYGKRAGLVRNEEIVKAGDMVLAFWDGKSRGTANSLSIAKRLKKPTLIIYA